MTKTRENPRLRVDFNDADDSDVIQALRKRASDPDALHVGQALRLEDGEKNACLGLVVKLDEKCVWVQAILSTWIDGQPVRISPIEELDAALQHRVTISAASGTAATEEFALAKT